MSEYREWRSDNCQCGNRILLDSEDECSMCHRYVCADCWHEKARRCDDCINICGECEASPCKCPECICGHKQWDCQCPDTNASLG